MNKVIETEICHTNGSTYHLQDMGWKILCFGHNDSRLTGGTWMYKGDEQLAHEMQQKRWRTVERDSDSYYSQCWV